MIWWPLLFAFVAKLGFAFASYMVTANNLLYRIATFRTNWDVQLVLQRKVDHVFALTIMIFQQALRTEKPITRNALDTILAKAIRFQKNSDLVGTLWAHLEFYFFGVLNWYDLLKFGFVFLTQLRNDGIVGLNILLAPWQTSSGF